MRRQKAGLKLGNGAYGGINQQFAIIYGADRMSAPQFNFYGADRMSAPQFQFSRSRQDVRTPILISMEQTGCPYPNFNFYGADRMSAPQL